MDMDLEGMRAFVELAGRGSFGEAAEALDWSQPTLSRRFQRFEDSLGVRLVDRTTRRVALTAVGRSFLPHAQRLLRDFDAAFAQVRGSTGGVSGHVTLACIQSAAFRFLPTVLAAFHARDRDTRVRVLDRGADGVVQAVLEGQAEFGVGFLGARRPELDFEPLFEDPFVLACHRRHPLAKLAQVPWSALDGHRAIRVGTGAASSLLLDLALAETPVRIDWFYEVDATFSTAIGFVEAQLGIALLPRLAIDDGSHPLLVTRPLVSPRVSRPLGIVRRRGITPSPAASRLLAEVAAHGRLRRARKPQARGAATGKARRG